jgi:hypothetical protein
MARTSRIRAGRTTAIVAAIAAIATVAGVGTVVWRHTDDDRPAAAAVALDGTTSATAAASCWEIKTRTPSAPDGAYWLYTPALKAPQQFFCDMTTDGGGWVLVGRGRESWQEYYDGLGSAASLLTRTRTPDAFDAVQLPAPTIDGLLNNTAPSALADGVRLVRARNAAGTSWQNVRFFLRDRDRWAWAFGANHPLSSATFDGAAAAGGSFPTFGRDSAWQRVDFSFSSAQKWTAGFAYGAAATGGSTGATTFLYSAVAGGTSPRPYTEMYLRPRLLQADLGTSPIPDAGTAASTVRPIASSYAAPGAWGVLGHVNGLTAEGNSPVQSFAQIGGTVFVAGNFEYVQKGAAATGADKVRQPALAAFDASTGEFIRSFTPVFDNQVKDLLALPNGKLLAVGNFTTVNGATATGTVLLDPTTGATDPSWTLQIENRLSTGVLTVRTATLGGDFVYLGGGFTHLRSATVTDPVYARHAARVRWATSAPDRTWNPEFDGTLVSNDMSPDGTRMYAAGYFTLSKTAYANKAAAVLTQAGAPLASPVWTTVWSNSDRSGYQQAIRATGNRVFVGGSEHSIFSYDPTTFNRTSGATTQGNGGDFQALDTDGSVMYGGCHCSSWTYENSFTWPTPSTGWTQADQIDWIGAWDVATGKTLPQFNPPFLGSENAGVWAIFIDRAGTVWAGGDLTGARTSRTRTQWAGGFVRFPTVDATAPTTPTGLRGTTQNGNTTLTWQPATDNSGSVSYEVLRDDRPIATTTERTFTVAAAANARYFVRAVDAGGNRSASTPVLGTDQGPDPILIDNGAAWSWRYSTTAPPSDWNQPTFDAASWTTGPAPLGWGSATIATSLDRPAADRNPVAYFRRDLTIADLSKVSAVTLTTAADDGQVVYVNGTEVARTRVDAGMVGNGTYANAAISTATANANPAVIQVPYGLLRTGTNTIAVSTHLNYKSTPNVSFDLRAVATFGTPPPTTTTTTTTTAPPNPPITLLNGTEVWSYRNDAAAPPAAWNSRTFDASTWAAGAVPMGWGSATIATSLDRPAAERPLAFYARRTVPITGAATVKSLRLTTIADDGIVVYVNGTEVARTRIDPGPVTVGTYANAAVSTAAAKAAPVVVDVPVGLLVEGDNVIAVETHLNYKSTPSASFEMTATLQP